MSDGVIIIRADRLMHYRQQADAVLETWQYNMDHHIPVAIRAILVKRILSLMIEAAGVAYNGR